MQINRGDVRVATGKTVPVFQKIDTTAANGETVVIEAGPEFKVLARNPLGPGVRVQASPAIAQGAIFIRSDRQLFCISDTA
ncbi:MAG: hypothetical protein HC869_25050 [Rhodospirillales bacterium]|nr:hypothetical protein [Rhodospirillales bacterium]